MAKQTVRKGPSSAELLRARENGEPVSFTLSKSGDVEVRLWDFGTYPLQQGEGQWLVTGETRISGQERFFEGYYNPETGESEVETRNWNNVGGFW
jgi:hypothetical protein